MCITYNMKADILEFEYLPFIIDSDNAILLEVDIYLEYFEGKW